MLLSWSISSFIDYFPVLGLHTRALWPFAAPPTCFSSRLLFQLFLWFILCFIWFWLQLRDSTFIASSLVVIRACHLESGSFDFSFNPVSTPLPSCHNDEIKWCEIKNEVSCSEPEEFHILGDVWQHSGFPNWGLLLESSDQKPGLLPNI